MVINNSQGGDSIFNGFLNCGAIINSMRCKPHQTYLQNTKIH